MDLSSMPMGALAETMRISLFLDGDTLVGTMPVEGNTQPYGILHGGATAVLVETLGSVASALAAPGRLPVGIELSVTHHRSASQGTVTGRAEIMAAADVAAPLAWYSNLSLAIVLVCYSSCLIFLPPWCRLLASLSC